MALHEPQVTVLAILLSSSLVCVKQVKKRVELFVALHESMLFLGTAIACTLEHLTNLPCLLQLGLHPVELIDARDFEAGWEECEIWLRNDARWHCMVVCKAFIFTTSQLLGLSLCRGIFDCNLLVKKAFETLRHVSVFQPNTDLGKVSHVVIHHAVKVVLLRYLENCEAQHEVTVLRKSLVDDSL